MIPPRASLVLGLAAVVVVGGIAAAVRTPGPDSTGAFIADDAGRALVQSGFNTASSSKQVDSGLPDFTEEDLDLEYAAMGTNFVRYLISWRKVEPEPGVYDQAYLDAVEERVSWYAARGYHVMLDMHQDLWGNSITPSGQNGNGAPEWATYMDGMPVAEDLPMWELYYLQPGVIRAFDNFWNTTGAHPELMDHYAGAWRAVAARFADSEAVVAYDIMNEPYGGTVQGPAFEAGPLTTLYQKSVDAIREVDGDTWACLEPQALGFNWGLPSGLGYVDDPRAGEPRIAFCPHIYPLPMDLGDGFTGTSRDLVEGTIAAWRSNVLRTADALGDVPVILGEFGLDTNLPGALDYVEQIYDTADASGFGVVYWSRDPGSWGPFEDDGTPRNLVEAVTRPYPRVVAGDLRTWSENRDELIIRLGEPGGDGESQAYLPPAVFANGAAIDGGEIVSWDPATGVLTFTIDDLAAKVTIIPAS